MKRTIVLISLTASFLIAADQKVTGVITDSMCGNDHSSMKMGNDAKCTVACVKAGAKYAIFDGKKSWTLSDQTAPEKFAGQKVTVTGSLNEKAGSIQVTGIQASK